jgi:hypothetical protein
LLGDKTSAFSSIATTCSATSNGKAFLGDSSSVPAKMAVRLQGPHQLVTFGSEGVFVGTFRPDPDMGVVREAIEAICGAPEPAMSGYPLFEFQWLTPVASSYDEARQAAADAFLGANHPARLTDLPYCSTPSWRSRSISAISSSGSSMRRKPQDDSLAGVSTTRRTTMYRPVFGVRRISRRWPDSATSGWTRVLLSGPVISSQTCSQCLRRPEM